MSTSSSSRGLFVRKPSRSRTSLLRPNNQKLKKRKPKEKPPWDNSTKDLTVYKPSPQELQRNHEIHQPRKDYERTHYRPQKSFDFSIDSLSLQDTPVEAAKKKRAMIKEVFYNQQQEFRTVLQDTDRSIADIDDLFGDDVQRYRGNPIVTKAPNSASHINSFLHVVEPEEPTRYDKLSATVMQASALNSISSASDGENTDSNNEDNRKSSTAGSYQSRMDLLHFESLARRSDSNHSSIPYDKSKIPDINTYSQFVNEIQEVIDNDNMRENSTQENNEHSNFTKSNEKENKKIKNVSKFKSRKERKSKKNSIADQENSVVSKNNSNSCWTFNDMKKKLDELDKEILEYEKECGREANSDDSQKQKTGVDSTSLSGYTMRLLSTITRIVNHLKESETHLRAEMAVRNNIIETFEEQRLFIDSLTNGLIELQEENSQLKQQVELLAKTNHLQFQHMNGEISMLKKTVNHFVTSQPPTTGKLCDFCDVQRIPLNDLNNRDNIYKDQT